MRTRLLLCLVAAVGAPLSSSCKDDPPPSESSGSSDGTSEQPTHGTADGSSSDGLGLCGDGVIDVGEACDDGNTTVMDGCSGCVIDPQYTCTGQPSECHTCGDGFRNPGEECDDGELIGQNSPGCLNCQVVEGWTCFPGDSADRCGPLCGDGIWLTTPEVTIGFAEGCDDGNLVDGDGCNASCDVEAGCECMGEPRGTSTCSCGGDDSGSSTGMDSDTDTGTDTDMGSGSGSDTGMGSSGTSTG